MCVCRGDADEATDYLCNSVSNALRFSTPLVSDRLRVVAFFLFFSPVFFYVHLHARREEGGGRRGGGAASFNAGQKTGLIISDQIRAREPRRRLQYPDHTRLQMADR